MTASLANAPTDLAQRLHSAIAQRLIDMARETEILAAQLCSDEIVAQQHSAELQGLDRLAQNLAGLSDVLAAPDVERAIAEITLQDLHDLLSSAA